MIRLDVSCRIDSSLSLNGRLHWAQRRRKTKALRAAVWRAWWSERRFWGLPCTVTLTRLGPRRMDDDNSVSALKAVRDEVAYCLGVDDGDPRITWRYAQERGAWGVRVEVTG